MHACSNTVQKPNKTNSLMLTMFIYSGAHLICFNCSKIQGLLRLCQYCYRFFGPISLQTDMWPSEHFRIDLDRDFVMACADVPVELGNTSPHLVEAMLVVEDMSILKRINVMVGITRSKVILFFVIIIYIYRLFVRYSNFRLFFSN